MTSFALTRSPFPGAASTPAASSAPNHRSAIDPRPTSDNQPSFDDVFDSEAGARRPDRRDAQSPRRELDRRPDSRTDSRLDDADERNIDDAAEAYETRRRREQPEPDPHDRTTASAPQRDTTKQPHGAATAHVASEHVAVDTPVSASSASSPEGDVEAATDSGSAPHIDPLVDALASATSTADDTAAIRGDSNTIAERAADAGSGITSPGAPRSGAAAVAASTDSAAATAGTDPADQPIDAAAISKQAARVTSEPTAGAMDQRPATTIERSGPTTASTIGQTTAPSDQSASPSSGLAAEQLRNTEMVRRSDLARLGATTRLGVDIITDELGAIRVEALERSGALHLTLSSDDGATRQMLAERSRELRESLGGDLASFDIDQGASDDDPRRNTPDGDGRVAASSAANASPHVNDPSVHTAATVATTVDGPLDLRL